MKEEQQHATWVQGMIQMRADFRSFPCERVKKILEERRMIERHDRRAGELDKEEQLEVYLLPQF